MCTEGVHRNLVLTAERAAVGEFATTGGSERNNDRLVVFSDDQSGCIVVVCVNKVESSV